MRYALASLLLCCRCPAPQRLQGLKRVELRDELYMQLVKQTRGNPNPAARAKAWQLFYLTAATMPPSKDFMGLVSGALLRLINRAAQHMWFQPPALCPCSPLL